MSSQFNHSDSTEFDRNSIMGSWSFFGGCDIQSPVRHSSQPLNKKQKYIPWGHHCLTIAERGWTQSYLRTSELVKSEVTWCNLQEDMLCTQQSLYGPWKFGGPADQKRLASDRSNMNTMTERDRTIQCSTFYSTTRTLSHTKMVFCSIDQESGTRETR